MQSYFQYIILSKKKSYSRKSDNGKSQKSHLIKTYLEPCQTAAMQLFYENS